MKETKSSPIIPFGTLATAALTSTGALAMTWIAVRKCKILRVAIKITTATSTTASVVVNVNIRPTLASSSGQTTIATLTIPTSIAANTVYYKDISVSTAMQIGDQLEFDVGTAATSTGIGIPLVYAEDSPEVPANNSNMVASA